MVEAVVSSKGYKCLVYMTKENELRRSRLDNNARLLKLISMDSSYTDRLHLQEYAAPQECSP